MVKSLIYKNYLSVISALPDSQLFRHLYVRDEDGQEVDAVNDGELSCAVVVSSVLTLFGWIDRPHATVKSTVRELANNDWRVTDAPRSGDVIVWPAGEAGNQHVGFYTGDGRAISNVAATGAPGEHGVKMSDGREPMQYYTRDYDSRGKGSHSPADA